MSDLITLFKCPDGTDFNVQWSSPEDAERSWTLEDVHQPRPLKPLSAAFWNLAQPGRDRAYAEAGQLAPLRFRGCLVPHGYLYLRTAGIVAMETAEEEQYQRQAIDRLAQRYGGGSEVWTDYSLPRLKDACRALQQATTDTPIPQLAETFGYALHVTMVAQAVAMGPMQALPRFLVAELGEEGEALAQQVIQGQGNASIEADQALWEVAQTAREWPAVRDTIVDTDDAQAMRKLPGVHGGAEFSSVLERYLERYGWRTEMWDASTPTLKESPSVLLGLIRRMIVDDSLAPLEAIRDVDLRSQRIKLEIESRLQGDQPKIKEFQELSDGAASFVRIREDRSLWQLTTYGSLRGAVLQKGARLAHAGRIVHADDVFFLLPDEIDRLVRQEPRDLKGLVQERKQEWEWWSQIRPPAQLSAEIALRGSAPDDGSSARSPNTLVGVAASRGVVTGTAKVISDLSESEKLLPGEILVCVTTSPAWTVLFGRARAVVTDSGGALAHAAIAAREYGIPCVAGVRVATRRIADGMTVTVDGAAGTVRLEG